MIDGRGGITDRLARYRASLRSTPALQVAPVRAPLDGRAAAERLAETLGGEIIRSVAGTIVRVERPSQLLCVDRQRLATLPGHPPADVALICLDTETTGLATAAGTVAFLIGLGWWEADRFRQVQLVLPDHGEEPALLNALRAAIPGDAWLVTYNGRGFDWPLLVARYRLAGQAAPGLAGHLDLLPIVRRLFRHRMPDARLQTAEVALLGRRRIGDVGGWEIPGRYLGFLHGGSADSLTEVLDHNDLDVRSLGQLLAYLADGLADPERRLGAHAGDLAGLARSFARERRLAEALECLEVARQRPEITTPRYPDLPTRSADRSDDGPWWSPLHRADFGGRPSIAHSRMPSGSPWTSERIAIDRAHLLRRSGHHPEAAAAWAELAAGQGRVAIVAMIELAKLREHRLADRPGALRIALDALRVAERRRRLGRPEVQLEADLVRRVARLRRRAVAGSVHRGRPSLDRSQVGNGRQPDSLHGQ